MLAGKVAKILKSGAVYDSLEEIHAKILALVRTPHEAARVGGRATRGGVQRTHGPIKKARVAATTHPLLNRPLLTLRSRATSAARRSTTPSTWPRTEPPS